MAASTGKRNKMTLPAQVSVVIIGGGIIGCSIAYHLARRGIRDVLLLERRQLCCGTTWHSVGSVAELRGTRRMTELIRYTAELYRNLEAETGQATGYRKSGSIMLALSRERLMEMERAAALARQFGHDAEMISVADSRAGSRSLHRQCESGRCRPPEVPSDRKSTGVPQPSSAAPTAEPRQRRAVRPDRVPPRRRTISAPCSPWHRSPWRSG